jgi:proline iminopeptidase
MGGTSKIISLSNGFHVWTRRIGDSPIKLLILHGGPGSSHEYLDIFKDYLPPTGVEIYFYDQLGSHNSDQPNDLSLWNVERFREEVEEVRQQLGLDQFYLCGQSWGGMLGIEYALKYQSQLKGLIISNMTASIASYVRYINQLRAKLSPELQQVLSKYEAEENYEAEEYLTLVNELLYKKHLCRLDPWPEMVKRGFSNINPQVYQTMQGPNEFLVTGTFKDWNRWDNLHEIHIPTLVIGGTYDTMDPADIEEMGRRIPNADVGICEKGSHLAMWDDADVYFGYIKKFIAKVEAAGK